MKYLTIIFGVLLVTTTMMLVSHGSIRESMDFSTLVNMNWSTSSAFHANPISVYLDPAHQTKVYAIIFDAGSTGTRIHVYKFRYSHNDSSFPYMLVDEVFDEIKPGLSSYAWRPADLRPGLQRLLQHAKRKVPQSLWGRTWMSLKATAGLRLLPPTRANRILREVEDTLSVSGFQLMPDGVSILSGLDEGVWSWVAVNFLLRHVHEPEKSVGIVDLGGGSVQITFVPSMDSVDATKHDVPQWNRSVRPYSQSYLGLGLMSARHAVLTASDSGNHINASLTSICVPYGYRGHWTFGGVRYTITGTGGSGGSNNKSTTMFEQCHHWCRQLVTKIVPVQPILPQSIGDRPFFIFSYFYDRVKDAATAGGSDILAAAKVTVDQYGLLAQSVCSSHDETAWQNQKQRPKPFLCLDLTYIYALLNDGFQISSNTVLHLNKKINNIELGWALGAVFDLLHQTEKV